METPKDLKNEIWEYCRVNNITNIDEFTLKLIRQGFTTEKFGSAPIVKTVEKVVEKIIEVPVEKIVERLVEVPVTMVDTELSDNLKKHIKLYEETQIALNKALNDNLILKKDLDIEREKNKKDIYGEG